MDISFQPTGGRPKFSIEVPFFDTVKEIKEKIQKYQGIPVFDQTLIFNDKALPDSLTIFYSDIVDRSTIKLLVTKNSTNSTTDIESPEKKIKVLVRMPLTKFWEEMEFDAEDPISRLKQKVHEMAQIELSCIFVFANGMELQEDNKSFREYELSDNSHVEITFSNDSPPSPQKSTYNTGTSSGNGNGNGNGNVGIGVGTGTVDDSNSNSTFKKLKVMVLLYSVSEKIPVEVNAEDNVEELRNELEKIRIQSQLELQFPEGGYFFIHNQNVMEEEQSFVWHQVSEGDTVEIFPGTLAGKTSSSRKWP